MSGNGAPEEALRKPPFESRALTNNPCLSRLLAPTICDSVYWANLSHQSLIITGFQEAFVDLQGRMIRGQFRKLERSSRAEFSGTDAVHFEEHAVSIRNLVEISRTAVARHLKQHFV